MLTRTDQVYQVHTKHRKKLDNLRGNNKAKTSDTLMSKLQQSPIAASKLAAGAPEAAGPSERVDVSNSDGTTTIESSR